MTHETNTETDTADTEPRTVRFLAIGDSFTEGVGDPRPDGVMRGWADLVAEGIASATGKPVEYANFAIRGRLLHPIIDEQLQAAIDMQPTILSFNGGGNDIMRPRADLNELGQAIESTLDRILDAGIEPLMLAGPNPGFNMLSGVAMHRRGDALVRKAREACDKRGVKFSSQWDDHRLRARQYWTDDRIHLNPRGHARVAANVLRTLGYAAPAEWDERAPRMPKPTARDNYAYWRQHVVPWVQRRLTGRSSGDGRGFKYAEWVTVEPREARER